MRGRVNERQTAPRAGNFSGAKFGESLSTLESTSLAPRKDNVARRGADHPIDIPLDFSCKGSVCGGDGQTG
jgi:hypothetical protein